MSALQSWVGTIGGIISVYVAIYVVRDNKKKDSRADIMGDVQSKLDLMAKDIAHLGEKEGEHYKGC